MFDVLNRFSFYSFAILSVLAGLFSYFVLHNNEATVFFGVATIACLLIHVAHRRNENELTHLEQNFNDRMDNFSRDQDAIYRYIDDRFSSCENSCKAKTGR